MTETASPLLGSHFTIMVATGRACQPSATSIEQADNLIAALTEAMDLVGAGIPAVRPRAASPDRPHHANRDRSVSPVPERALARPLPMNPVQRHHGTGGSQAPTSLLDSDYWRHQYTRVHDHWDRCEVIRRAAKYLASLLAPDPAELAAAAERAKMIKNPALEQQILVDGHGHHIHAVARSLNITVRAVAICRIQEGIHPVTGYQWTPPDDNHAAADQARAMKAAGLTSTDIGLALGRGASTVRNWTSGLRRAA